MSVLVNTQIPSFFWPIYEELFANVVEHLHVDLAIIDYNYARLTKCVDLWAKERLIRFQKTDYEVTLNQREYAIALEFFLQIDGKRERERVEELQWFVLVLVCIVDLFYMKTCSFRQVQPIEPNKYLFCSTDPIARHEMTACGNCGLCYPKYDVNKRGQPSAVDFGPATRRHQFVNRYETILNCPCVSCFLFLVFP